MWNEGLQKTLFLLFIFNAHTNHFTQAKRCREVPFDPVTRHAEAADFTSMTSLQIGPKAFICPPSDAIYPCTCTFWGGQDVILCRGPEVTQGSIEQVVSESRIANNVAPDDWINIMQFFIENTTLSTLDVTPLIRVSGILITIGSNPNLTSIVGPKPIQSYLGLIDTYYLDMPNNNLTNEGLGDSLKYFLSSRLRRLSLNGNKFVEEDPELFNFFTEAAAASEFLPGLSDFENLSKLYLAGNRIKRLADGQFKLNKRLDYISIGNMDEGLPEIGPNAFLLDDPDSDMLGTALVINFVRWYSSQDFNESNTIDYVVKRPVRLDFSDDNQLDSLNSEFFEPFLNSHGRNEIIACNNPLICDSRMTWLKDQKEEFEPRVQCPCSNDPGYDCFTSDLI